MIRTRRTGRGYALRGAAVVAVVAMAGVTAGCKEQPAAGAPAASSAPAGSGSATDDAKPGGGATSPSASTSASASASATPGPDQPEEPKEPVTASPKPSASSTAPAADPQGKVLMASGAEGGQVRELQARLRQIGHFNRTPTGYYGTVTVAAVQSFQGKRGLVRTGKTDTVTWQKLLGMTHEPTAAELNPPTTRPVAKPDKRCLTGRVLCISKNSRTLSWMIDGKVVSSMDVRFGSQYTPTREGTFSVYWKSRHHVSSIYHTAMPYAMFFSGGQAVHYSSDFAARGYNGASHGCVNVRDEGKIAALFAAVRTGDKVVVYK
ncbi:murein L,D-transpeptidase [Streptomyces sp. 130]|uniref:L,D-transpeptidase family protein n=1 Tax=Streptomyces sp. 130 TaxID=2591006 RepID=UPI00117E4754|nr:L,D-transpeptidase family protein [Streptomyces sp. 130]TRV75006.1 murein L,D-transpeptidase [Streptomyces sp. 130]